MTLCMNDVAIYCWTRYYPCCTQAFSPQWLSFALLTQGKAWQNVQWCAWTLGWHVEEWHIPGKLRESIVITTMNHGATKWSTSVSIGNISQVQKAILFSTNPKPPLHSSTQHPGTSLHVTSFTSVSTANDKHWREKVWVW